MGIRSHRLLLVSLLLGGVVIALLLSLLQLWPLRLNTSYLPLTPLLIHPTDTAVDRHVATASPAALEHTLSATSTPPLPPTLTPTTDTTEVSVEATPTPLDESAVVLLTFVSACKKGLDTLIPILRSIERWAAHTRIVLPAATLVVALPRVGWKAYVEALADDQQRIACTALPTRTLAPTGVTLSANVTVHGFAPSASLPCPLGADLLLFLEDMPRAVLTADERAHDARHSWFPDGCYELWRDRITAIQAMQQLSPRHRAVVSLDPDAYICPGSAASRLLAHLQPLVHEAADSVSAMAPIPLGNGAVPYLPSTALERNCGVLAFAAHAASRALTRAWQEALYKQVMCDECDLHGDQSAYREAVYEHYARQGRDEREHIVGEADFCRWKSSCATGCLIVHRHDNERGYTGNASMPEGPSW